jgi:hypothetical protein
MLLDKIKTTSDELANLSHRAQGFPTVLNERETRLQAMLDGEVCFGDSKVVLGIAKATRMIDVSAAYPNEDTIICGEIEENRVNPDGVWLCGEEPDDIKALFN